MKSLSDKMYNEFWEKYPKPSKIMYLTSGKKYELSILLNIQIDFIKAGNEVLCCL